MYLLTQWVETGRMHKKWLVMYKENKGKQDDYADSFLQCYAEECKLAQVFPTWSALQELWGFLIKDAVFMAGGKCPLELTAEMQKKYDAYLRKLDKIKEKKEKQNKTAEEKREKAAGKKKKQHANPSVMTGKLRAPPLAAAASSVTTRVTVTVDDIECTPPKTPLTARRSTELSKPPPASKSARRVALQLESVGPDRKTSGPTEAQRTLQSLFRKAKEESKKEKESKRARDDPDDDDDRDRSWRDDDEEDRDFREAIKASMRESLSSKDVLAQEDIDLLLEGDDLEQRSERRMGREDDHILVSREQRALERKEKELAASNPLVVDIISEDESSSDEESKEGYQLSRQDEGSDEEEFRRLAEVASAARM
jgi:hypothetical protein